MTKPSDWHLGMTFFAFDWRLWGDEIRSGGCRFRVESCPRRPLAEATSRRASRPHEVPSTSRQERLQAIDVDGKRPSAGL